MDGVAAYLETNLMLFLFNFEGGASYWNMAISMIPPLYLYTIQMRMVTSGKAKYNFWQVGPTESETLIGLIILLPAVFGRDVYEQMVSAEYGIQMKHIAAGAYLIVQSLMIMDCIVESLINNAKASLRMYLPAIPIQALFIVGCTNASLAYLGNYGLYNLMFQAIFNLQYILLTVEDLTGVSKSQSRFPGFDYLLITFPFAFYHITSAMPALLMHSPFSQDQYVWFLVVVVTTHAGLK